MSKECLALEAFSVPYFEFDYTLCVGKVIYQAQEHSN